MAANRPSAPAVPQAAAVPGAAPVPPPAPDQPVALGQPLTWPNYPPAATDDDGKVSATDPLAEYKKIKYQAEVSAVAGEHLPEARADREKAIQAAEIDRAKTESANDFEREKAAWASEYGLRQAVQQAYLDVAKGTIDRAQGRAQFVQTAAGAIGTAYGAVLALTPKSESGAPAPGPAAGQITLPAQVNVPGQAPAVVQITLPAQLAAPPAAATNTTTTSQPMWLGSPAPPLFAAIVPTLFLGIAIAGATIYTAYLTRPSVFHPTPSGASLLEQQLARVKDYIGWASSPAERRLWALHAAIVALAVGVVLLPLAFLHPNSAAVWGCLVGGMLLVILVPLAFDRLSPSQHNADTGDITTPLTLK